MTEQKLPEDSPNQDAEKPDFARRQFFKKLGMVSATGAVAAVGANDATNQPAWNGSTFMDALGDFFQDHYVRMSDEEMQDALDRIKRKAKRKFGVDIDCNDDKPIPGTYFGYALNLSKCRGYRDCVEACV